MKRSKLRAIIVLGLIFSFLFISDCSKPKEAKVIVKEHEFAIRQIRPHAYTIDAKGKVKNIGGVDVKRVVLTGYCRSCSDGLAPGRWTVSPDRERVDNEKDMINYLVAGGEADFNFSDVAVMYPTDNEVPKELPEQLEIVIDSFEVVD
jgi:hypothetical protein